jgi:hypothetical protein
MNDTQLQEFESIIDHKDDIVIAWLNKYVPNYHNEPGFIKLQQATDIDVNDPALRSEYAATKWLEVNRPDYKAVVDQVLEDLKQEVIANRSSILN